MSVFAFKLGNSGLFFRPNTAFWAVLSLNQGLSFLEDSDDVMDGVMDNVIDKNIDNIMISNFKSLI